MSRSADDLIYEAAGILGNAVPGEALGQIEYDIISKAVDSVIATVARIVSLNRNEIPDNLFKTVADLVATFSAARFDKWLCGDLLTGDLLEIDMNEQGEVGDPLRMRIETGPAGAFPQAVRINSIELYLTKGVGIATGSDPVQTDPDVEISVSRDGGQTWGNPRVVKVGRQALANGRVRSSIWGQAGVQGMRWRFDMSSNVPFAIMGADVQADKLR